MTIEGFLQKQAARFGFSYGIEAIADAASRLDSQGDAYAAAVLTPAEQILFRRYRVRKRRVEWLAGRLAARQALAAYLQTPVHSSRRDAFAVLSRESRAPFIAGYPELQISISHSHEYAVAVVAAFGIGLDLEKIETRPQSLAGYFCTRDERLQLESELMPSRQWDERMTRFWSRKEAIAKYLQLGGQLDFGRIDTIADEVVIDGPRRCPVRLVTETCGRYCVSLAL